MRVDNLSTLNVDRICALLAIVERLHYSYRNSYNSYNCQYKPCTYTLLTEVPLYSISMHVAT